MKVYYYCALLLLSVSCGSHTQSSNGPIPKDKELERRVEATLKKMTIDEKVGQMTELAIDMIVDKVNGEYVINEEKLQRVIAEYKVGSILNAPGPQALSKDKWHQIISRIQEVSMKEIGIPCIYGLDQNHGTTYTADGTLFPQNINMAASFNEQLVFEAASITAYETRASNCTWTYSPTLDMARDPRWPRVWENYGEDCLVNAVMGVSATRGFQGDDPNHIPADKIAVSAKHYMGYSQPRTGKDRTPAYISEAELREKCFAPYKACVEAGALTIMVNSSSINGLPVHANRELLTGWLKEDLGWDGMLLTDWSDINNLYSREHIASDKKEAIAIAINAGIDMSMEPYDLEFCTLLKELVREGTVSQSRIDDAVRRVLRLKFRLGLFDAPNSQPSDYPLFASAAHAEASLRAARESEVLLKNKAGILPLDPDSKILITGPNANSMRCLNGGWSYSWQGQLTDKFAEQYNTIYEAMCQRFGEKNVILEQGVTYKQNGAYYEENEPMIHKAVKAAAGVDVIVACIGENSYCETPGNLTDLALSANQRELVKALATTGKPIVLVLNEGRPRLINDIEPLAQAIIDILLPGNYGADALAEILAGDVNPSAKLPYTYPRNQASLTTYDYRVSEETDRMEGAYDYNAAVSVQWPFGFGLSYTSFAYSNFTVSISGRESNAESKTVFEFGDTLTFSADVTNIGKIAGKEVTMLYSRDLVASLTPENRRLRAFKKVELQPGETRRIELTIPASDLAFVGYDGKWVLEKGEFRIQLGDQTLNTFCNKTYSWQ